MNPGVFPLVAVALILLALTAAWPEFWIPNEHELPFDADDETRGNWEKIPSQGHPPDVG